MKILGKIIENSNSRYDLWNKFILKHGVSDFAEIGVYKGEFAEKVLQKNESIKRYYMVDPWRHLDDWNKPANKSDEEFDLYYKEAIAKTDFASHTRIILRGKTTEIIDQIPDNSLDLAYIDGDHTLKGITIDLIRLYPKIREGGWIGGDDFSPTIWQHQKNYEPTLVFPFAVYFAEAVSARIFALPYNQFLIEKSKLNRFEFIDLTDKYKKMNLRSQLIDKNNK